MSIARVVGTGLAWNSIGTIALKIVSFTNIFIILTHLSVYEYGLTELTMSVVSTIGLFLLPGLAATITADLGVERARQEYGKMKALFLEFFTLHVLLGIVAWAVLFFGSSIVAHWTGNDLIDRFFKIVSFTFLSAPFRTATTMLATVFVRYADISFFGVLEEICKGVLLGIFLIWFEMGAAGLLYAVVISPVLAIACYAPRTISAYRKFSHATPDTVEPIWKILREHRKWSVTATYVGTLSANIRLWIIKIFLGTEAVGIFGFVYGLFSHAISLLPLTSLITPLVPKFIDRKIELVRLIRAAMKFQLYIAAALILAGFVFAPPFITYFFPKYTEAIPLLYILLFGLISNSLASPLNPVFLALKEQKSVLFSQMFKNILTIIILPVTILLFGIAGVCIEVVLTTLLSAGERYLRLRKMIPEFSISLRSLLVPDAHERALFFRLLEGALYRAKNII